MLDLNQNRAEFAEFLAGNASKRHSLEAGNGSQAHPEPAQVATAGISGDAGGAWQGGSTESGDSAAAPEPLKGGALAKLAGMWCNDADFQTWMRGYVPDLWDRLASNASSGDIDHLIAGNCIRHMVGVKTRAELDHNPEAAALFKRLILQPYADHLKAAKA